jgi:hypothetical protein
MKFVLFVGCLNLCACAAVATVRLRTNLSRTLAGFPPIYENTMRLGPRTHSATNIGGHRQKSLNRSGDSSV